MKNTVAHPIVIDKRVCTECGKSYRACEDCGKMLQRAEQHHVCGNVYCESCLTNNYIICDQCGRYDQRHDDDYRCGDCGRSPLCENCFYNDHDPCESDNLPTRHADEQTDTFISATTGVYITSPRIFGVEVECYYPNRGALERVADESPRAVGITYDDSVGDDGIEFQTPRLAGASGEQLIMALSHRLMTEQYTVGRSCGLHVHLDCADFSSPDAYEQLQNFWLFHLVFEDVFLAFLPPTRRRSRYCLPMKHDFHTREIRNAKSRTELEVLWYRLRDTTRIDDSKARKYHNTRYFGINLHSFFRAGHVEIRYHSGTINAVKILRWVNLHASLLDRIADGSISLSAILSMQNALTMKDKLTAFFTLLCLSDREQRYWLSRVAKFNPDAVILPALNTADVCAA